MKKGSYMCLQFVLKIYAMLDDFIVKAFDMLCGNSTLSKYFEYQQSPKLKNTVTVGILQHTQKNDTELMVVVRRVTKNSQWGAVLWVLGPSPLPREANGSLGAKLPAARSWGSGGGTPSARKFCIFLQK